MSLRILVVDDSATMQKVVRIALSRFDVAVVAAATIIEALSEVSKTSPDLIIIDALISGTRSLDDLKSLATEAKNCPFLLLVGTHQNINEGDYRSCGFKAFLRKPFESADMVVSIAKTLGRSLPQSGGETSGIGLPPPPPGAGPAAGQEKMPVFNTTVLIPPPPNKRAAAGGNDDFVDPALPPPPKIDQTRRGQKAFPDADIPMPAGDGARTAAPLPPPPPAMTSRRPPPPPSSSTRTQAAGGDSGDAAGREEVAQMVRQAVEEYCQKHFPALAREIITAELRRLAEDRARHFIE